MSTSCTLEIYFNFLNKLCIFILNYISSTIVSISQNINLFITWIRNQCSLLSTKTTNISQYLSPNQVWQFYQCVYPSSRLEAQCILRDGWGFYFAKLIVLYGNQSYKIHWVYLLTLFKFNQTRICSNKILWLNKSLTGFNV